MYSINTMMMDVIGDYLVDSEGMTLYYFTKDEPGMSNASAAVIANWPVFYASDIMVPSNLDAADFGTITRSDGKMQTTFRGWPLYYYAHDMMEGDMMGQGLNDVWFVVSPESFMPPKFYPLVSGWYKDQAVKYYDFGANTHLVNGKVADAPIYALIYGMKADGSPDFVPGQHNIIDVLPGQTGYSDLWDVNLVTVPQDYTADSIRSADELMAMDYPMVEAGLLVNCPIVPPGSTTETGRTLVQGWYMGQKVYYFDYGMNSEMAAPIYALITGMDAEGNPQFVEGQHNIIDVIPGDEGYSAFWHVHLVTVPADYAAETFKSADAVMTSGYEMTETDILVNCPVVEPGS
jgi:predicted lipoprotein with Yx(FWY)xxD motif